MIKKGKKEGSGVEVINAWLADKGLYPFQFQKDTWQFYVEGLNGIVNAPTGYGKTYAVFLAVLIDWINRNPDYKKKKNNGLQLLWITPLRALAKDIARAMESALEELHIPWKVALRSGDTTTGERAKQKKNMPEILITTPESVHLLIATKGYKEIFKNISCIAVDEWHELLGTKRGVQVELALSHLKKLRAPSDIPLRIWGISATIGNLQEAMQVLLGDETNGTIVRSNLQKKIALHTILPETVERFPWAGHMGVKMISHVLPVIHKSRSTLLFTNVRSQAEIWYQALLNADPDLAGVIALHHSAIDTEMRTWVEEQLHLGTLKVVVCTASLDLGVDFRPVDTVIQIGSPKGVARFLQRAGRSGHEPDAISNIYFVPTHSLEIVEGAALQKAYELQYIENRKPVILAFDVLVQYMVTRALSEGFESEELYAEIITTHCYADLTREEWDWLLAFIIQGGQALQSYNEYHKVIKIENRYHVADRRIAMRHRLNIGTIVGDNLLHVKYIGGGFVGTIEETFISSLNPGDVFVLAGRKLELAMVKDMTALVRKSNSNKFYVPAWMGGRIPLSANLAEVLRNTFQQAAQQPESNKLLLFLKPLFDLQAERSRIPKEHELLTELIETKDGYHLFVYPFEGRLVHQSMASLLAYRISKVAPISFSIAMNDYGFELLSDKPIPFTEENCKQLFDTKDWYTDLQRSINATELSKRKFRDIAVISGLIFQGFPGEYKKARHLQNSSSLIYHVLQEHEPAHLLLRQAYYEALTYELETERLYKCLQRIENQNIVISKPVELTPFCFPIKVDSLRDQLSSEKLEDRIKRMQQQAAKRV